MGLVRGTRRNEGERALGETMKTGDHNHTEDIGEMTVRRTALPDGRYLIYFDFPDAEQRERPEPDDTTAPQDTNV